VGLLEGVRVLDVTRLLPGGFCSMVLADLGAEVVKVEQPGLGDYMRFTPPTVGGLSPVHAAVNRNKLSIGLNLKSKEGKRIVHQLLRVTDVFLEGFRPGAIERLGLSFEMVKRVNPHIIYCSISAFGHANPMSSMPGHDLNFQAMSGALGYHRKPSVPYIQLGDICAGMYAAIGVLGALSRKTRSAVYVDVPIVQALTSWLVIPVSAFVATGASPKAGQSLVFGSEPYYNLYRTADDKYVAVAAIEEQFWQNLLRELGLTELAGLRSGKISERRMVARRLAQTFASKSRDEWGERLMGRDTCVTPVLSLEDILKPAPRSAGRVPSWASLTLRALSTPLKIRPTARRSLRRAPSLGEQTHRILAGLGYTSKEMRLLRLKGVIE